MVSSSSRFIPFENRVIRASHYKKHPRIERHLSSLNFLTIQDMQISIIPKANCIKDYRGCGKFPPEKAENYFV